MKRMPPVDAEQSSWEAIYDAVESSDMKATAAWLDAGGDVNATITADHMLEGNIRSVSGMTMLMHATAAGHPKLAELLIQRGANVNQKNSNGGCALMNAVVATCRGRKGSPPIVRELLRAGADAKMLGIDNKSAVEFAVSLKCPKEVVAMLEAAILMPSSGAMGSKATLPRPRSDESWIAISDAIRSGDVKAITAWLDAGGDVNATLAREMPDGPTLTDVTMLMGASGHGNLKVVKLLTQRGANVNLQDSAGASALMHAVYATRERGPGSPNIVRELLRAGADVLLCDGKGYTALNIAVKVECPTGVVAMLEAAILMPSSGAMGSRAPVPSPPEACLQRFQLGSISDAVTSARRISDAVTSGDVKTTAAWLDAGGDVDAMIQRAQRITMLIRASAHGHLKLVKLLIQRGASVNLQDSDGTSALMNACGYGHLNVVELLIQRGANLNLQDSIGASALMRAVAATNEDGPGSPAIVRELLRAGADVQLRSCSGSAALDFALYFKAATEVISMLEAASSGWEAIYNTVKSGDKEASLAKTTAWLDAGGDVNATIKANGASFSGLTMLMHASATGHLPLVELLIRRGADVNLQDSIGTSALTRAVAETREGGKGKRDLYVVREAIVRELLRAGADVTVPIGKGKTVATFAALVKCPKEVVTMLETAMPRPPPCDVGWKSIYDAVISGDVNGTAAWLDAGGDVNSTIATRKSNGDRITGNTMLMHASGKGHLKMVQLLLTRRASINLQDSLGMSALAAATQATREGGPGSPAIVRELLLQGADTQLRDKEGETARDAARLLKCPDEVIAMLEAMPSSDAAGLEVTVIPPSNTDLEAILEAVTLGDVETTMAWLDAGGDINAKFAVCQSSSKITGMTLLINASLVGQQKVVELLIQRGASVNLQDSLGNSALINAVVASRSGGAGNPDIVSELLRAGADARLRDIDGRTALDFAVQTGCKAEVVAMLNATRSDLDGGKAFAALQSAALQSAALQGWEAIAGAVRLGDVEATRVWLDAGGDISSIINAALMDASVHGQLKIIKLLIERGANVNVQSSDGNSVLMYAVVATRKGGKGSAAIVRELLRADADVMMRNANNDCAAGLAIRSTCPTEVVDILKAASASQWRASELAAMWRADAAMAALLAEEEQSTKQKQKPPAEKPKSKKAKKKAKKKKGGGASAAGHSAAAAELAADSSSEDEEAASAQSSSREAEATAAREQAEAEYKAQAEAEAKAKEAEEEAEWERLETAKAIAQVAEAEAAEAASIAAEREAAAREVAAREAASEAERVVAETAARDAQEAAARATAEEQERLRRQATEEAAAAPPQALTLADVGNLTGRNDAPESTIGGQTTCIVCMVGAKTHLAVPCGHQSVCADCAGRIRECPYCREPVQLWVQQRLV